MEIVEVRVTGRADAMFVEKGNIVRVCLFNMSDNHQADSFVRIKEVKNSDSLLCEVSL